ncbi:ATP-binding cassette domain-containing protein [Prosthecobacter sp.]|uniref:ATP-binding cassette domain-containing protein n=1 Tax=Prosthecobacter sp. TaxID=1965333 RepID=UPI003784E2CC
MQGLIDYFTNGGQLKKAALSKGRMTFEQADFEWLPHRLTWSVSASSLGTAISVNGRALTTGGTVLLQHLDEILIGATRARFLRVPDVPVLRSKPCREVLLTQRKLLIGRTDTGGTTVHARPDQEFWQLDPEDDRNTARIHVEIHPADGGYVIHDRSATGTYLNGAAFQDKSLIPGDRFVIGSYHFEFTGNSICCVDCLLGARVEGRDLSLAVRHEGKVKTIMNNVSIEVNAGDFLGILGGSGQGKSTLMNLLGGVLKPSKGHVLVDGDPIEEKLLAGSVVGFVPQDDIVHSELTVITALTLTARLRLAVSRRAIDALVTATLQKLGLEKHSNQPIRSLSGGQRKRVNIATELLVRPSILFLDEPTSGLDPENEESVVSTLQNLSLTGQTVVCTTHSLHKAFLFKRIAFVHDGRLIFLGTQDQARAHFFPSNEDATSTDTSGPNVRLERIYKRVNEQGSGELWQQKFRKSAYAPFSADAVPPPRRIFARPPRQARPGFFGSLKVLVSTQWHVLVSDRKNWKSILLQALLIGLLAGWVGREDPEFRFFACLIATLWFGCSNAAQAIVRELPIFCRERIAGLSMHPYIMSKTLFLSLISGVQIVLLLLAQAVPVLLTRGADADPAHDLLPTGGIGLFVLAFALMGVVGVQIGLALSSLARTVTQAALWVPLALIPQILFSGFVVIQPEMPDSARIFSCFVPSSCAQRLVDLSNLAGKRVPLMTDDTEVPMFFWTNQQLKPYLTPGRKIKDAEQRERAGGVYREIDEYNTAWQNSLIDPRRLGDHKPGDEDVDYVKRRDDIANGKEAGDVFDPQIFAGPSIVGLGVWTGFCYLVIWLGLSLAQPAPLRPRWLQGVSV